MSRTGKYTQKRSIRRRTVVISSASPAQPITDGSLVLRAAVGQKTNKLPSWWNRSTTTVRTRVTGGFGMNWNTTTTPRSTTSGCCGCAASQISNPPSSTPAAAVPGLPPIRTTLWRISGPYVYRCTAQREAADPCDGVYIYIVLRFVKSISALFWTCTTGVSWPSLFGIQRQRPGLRHL